MKFRHFIPLAFVLSLVILTLMSLIRPILGILPIAELLIYLMTALFFGMRISREREDVNAMQVLWAFLVLHMAYGIGSFWSIITIPFKFPNRKKTEVGKPISDRKI